MNNDRIKGILQQQKTKKKSNDLSSSSSVKVYNSIMTQSNPVMLLYLKLYNPLFKWEIVINPINDCTNGADDSVHTQILVSLQNGKSTYVEKMKITHYWLCSFLGSDSCPMLCAACYCYISQTSDSEVTHSIFCTIEYDRAQNGMCGCAKRQRLTGGEEAADKEGGGGLCGPISRF